MNHDDLFMRHALEQAEKAYVQNEVPVGAVLVHEDTVIARAHNAPISHCDPSAHAEILVLREAAKKLGNYRLLDTTLYVTLEPCLMCLGALVHARIARLVFGASDPREGAVRNMNPRFLVSEGVCAAESRELLQRFFRERRE